MARRATGQKRDVKKIADGHMKAYFGKTAKKPEPDDLPARTKPSGRGARMRRLAGKYL